MEDVMEENQANNVLYELAREIKEMTEEEKLLSLKKIVRAELEGQVNRFWTTVSKKMLVNEELLSKIVTGKGLLL